jgi:hypothetical protein
VAKNLFNYYLVAEIQLLNTKAIESDFKSASTIFEKQTDYVVKTTFNAAPELSGARKVIQLLVL